NGEALRDVRIKHARIALKKANADARAVHEKRDPSRGSARNINRIHAIGTGRQCESKSIPSDADHAGPRYCQSSGSRTRCHWAPSLGGKTLSVKRKSASSKWKIGSG